MKTLEQIMQLQDERKTILFKTYKFAPLAFPDGSPMVIGFPEPILEGPLADPVIVKSERHVVLLHPSNLEALQQAAEKAGYTLQEWHPRMDADGIDDPPED